jgi:hypothetical protein
VGENEAEEKCIIELHNFCPSKHGAYYLGDKIKRGSQVISVRIVTKLPAE